MLVVSGLVCTNGGFAYAQAEEPELPADVLVEDPNFPPSQGDFSIDGLRKQIEAEPGRSDLLVTLMLMLMDAGQYQEALKLLEPLDELGDAEWRSEGHLIAGKIVSEKLAPDSGEMREGLLEQALKQFSIAIELDQPYPTNLAAYWYLGNLQAELGRIDDAIETLSTYLVLKPLAYEARLRLAEIYFGRGDKDKARILLAEMKSDPDEDRRGQANALLKQINSSGWLKPLIIAAIALAMVASVLTTVFIIKVRGRKRLKGGLKPDA
jgi:FimV-like protein